MTEKTGDAVIVIGGGLAGLTAAAFLAKGGIKVQVFDAGQRTGGRAQTDRHEGFFLNQGPRALMGKGKGIEILGELEITPLGKPPKLKQANAYAGGELVDLPISLASMLSTTYLNMMQKLALGQVLSQVPNLNTEALNSESLQSFVERSSSDEKVKQVLYTLLRLSTYCHRPDTLSAGAALKQLQTSTSGGVLYLHGGWQSLVNALSEKIEAAGSTIHQGKRVVSVKEEADGVTVECQDETFKARGAVLAVSPRQAFELLGEVPNLAPPQSKPIKAACLDVCLRTLPVATRTFVLGVGQPYYLSVHSVAAELAPAGGAMLHVLKYLSDDEETQEDELLQFLSVCQPGFEKELIYKRFLPKITVSYGFHSAAVSGQNLYPSPQIAGLDKITVAGDWVGSGAMLADAAIASGKEAAKILATALLKTSPTASA